MKPDRGDVLSPFGPGSGTVYQPTSDLYVALAFLAVILMGGAGVLAWAGLGQADGHPIVTLPLALVCLALAGLILASMSQWATVLYPDRIEARSLFRTSYMRKAEIAGYRPRQPRYGPPIRRLVSRLSSAKPLSIYVFRRDAAFDAWFDGIPDLDEADLQAASARLLEDPALGSTRAQREARLALLKRIAIGFSILTAMLGAAVWFVPEPPKVAVLALMLVPPSTLLLVWWSKGGIGLVPTKADPRPNIILGLFAAFPLILRAIQIQTLDGPALVMGCVGVTAAMLGGLWALTPKPVKEVSALIYPAVLSLAYGWSSVILINQIGDTGKPRVTQAIVIDKWVHHGRSTSWNLKVAPWGPVRNAEVLGVQPNLYNALQRGDLVCMNLYPGALGMGWYVPHLCEPRSPYSNAGGLTLTQDPEALYPDAARRQNIEGRTRFRCTVSMDGTLTACRVTAEQPAGYGFAQATLKLTTFMRMGPTLPDGQPSVGQTIERGVNWRLPRN